MYAHRADFYAAPAELVCRYLPDTTLVFVNEAYCKFFGRSQESLVGRRFIELIPRSLHSATRAHVEQLCRERKTLMSEHPVVNGSAGVRWQEWVDSIASASESGDLVLQGTGRDVTVRHASSGDPGEEKFFRGGVWVLTEVGLGPNAARDWLLVLRRWFGIHASTPASEIDRWLRQMGRLMTLGEMAASVIHEISQPLSAVLANLEAAGASPGMDRMSVRDLSDVLNEIRGDALRAAEMVRQGRALLSASSMNDVVDLNEVTTETVRLVRAESDRSGTTVEADLRTLPTLRGSRVELQQVLLNLILNGIEAMADTPREQRRLRICTRRTSLDRICVLVADAGCGVPPDQLPRLFESLYTTKERGLGMGLAIARRIVAAHGGRIRARNNAVGPGATFTVVLPSTGRATR